MLRRVNKFYNQFHNNSIEEYFGIPNNDQSHITCRFTINEENEDDLEPPTITITICFQKKNNKIYDFKKLPKEMNQLIASYYEFDTIHIETIISFPFLYPFHPPVWNLFLVKHNINHPMNLTEYYQEIVDNHNHQYEHYWSPATNIEQDILDFIRKINHFDVLLEYK